MIDGDPSGIVSSVLQSTKPIKENLKNIASLSIHVVIQVREYPTHFAPSHSSSSSSSGFGVFKREEGL